MTKQELFDSLDPSHHATVKRWLHRGDGVAVYENHDLGHPDAGHRKFVSFGSAEAQLEPEHLDPHGNPPERMPDIGAINWRYTLIGTVRYALNEIIVGNVGTVYSGHDSTKARNTYLLYRIEGAVNELDKLFNTTSMEGTHGRAAGEAVTWMRDGEPYVEHEGTVSDDDT